MVISEHDQQRISCLPLISLVRAIKANKIYFILKKMYIYIRSTDNIYIWINANTLAIFFDPILSFKPKQKMH